MKDKFHGYYAPSSDQFEELWKNALVVVDANVLLNLYTYSSGTREEILSLLEEFEERVWLPYNVAYEYHKNRCGIIAKEARQYDRITKELRSVQQALSARKQHPFIKEELFQGFTELVKQIEADLASGKNRHDELIRKDPIRERITTLFEGRVGEPTAEDELKKAFKEGVDRYAKKIPPGYKDQDKPEPERYGDLVVWKQVIQQAAKLRQSVIFVTDDEKEDWWLTQSNARLGPHPELLHEFARETDQQLYIYTSESFAEAAKEHGKEVSNNAVEELKTAADQRHQTNVMASRVVERLRDLRVADSLARATRNTLKLDRSTQEALKSIKLASPSESLNARSLRRYASFLKGIDPALLEAVRNARELDLWTSAQSLEESDTESRLDSVPGAEDPPEKS